MRFYQYIHLSSLHPAHLLQCSCPSHIININTWHLPVLFSPSCEWWAQLWLRPLSPMPWWLTLSLCAPVSMFYFLSVFLHMSSEHHVTLTTGVYHSCFKKKKNLPPLTSASEIWAVSESRSLWMQSFISRVSAGRIGQQTTVWILIINSESCLIATRVTIGPLHLPPNKNSEQLHEARHGLGFSSKPEQERYRRHSVALDVYGNVLFVFNTVKYKSKIWTK